MDKRMNFLFSIFVVGLLVLGSTANAFEEPEAEAEITDTPTIKNVIVMVPDGCDQDIQTLARWYSGEELQLDSMYSGMVSTYMANSVITGSAAAGTAFATGEKTTVRFVSVGPRTDDLLSTLDAEDMAEPYVPLATVLEGAKLEGKATGLVATSEIPHATPAVFAAHVDDRGNYHDIIEQMVYNDVDVVFAGGKDFLNASWRADGEDLIAALDSKGYQFVETEDEMMDLESGKVWGMFAGSAMSPEMNREDTEEPSIADMTSKAIKLLSEDEDGFFLMVEGSQVDWAGHANNAEYMVTDFLAFDEAVEVAVDFAEEDGHTLVLVFPDHNCGGMTIGNRGTSYTDLTVEELLDTLDESGEIGWTSGGHTGGDVPLWSYGPDRPIGLFDNTELATCVADAFGFELDDVSEELFVDVEEAFPGKWILQDIGNDGNLQLKITAENTQPAYLEINKDILTIGGNEFDLEGVVVYAPKANDGDGAIFIPQDAVDIIKNSKTILAELKDEEKQARKN